MHVYVTWGILWTDQLMRSFITPQRRDPIEMRRGSASIQPTNAFFSSPHRLDYLQSICIRFFSFLNKERQYHWRNNSTYVLLYLLFTQTKVKPRRSSILYLLCVHHSGVWALWPYRLFTQQIFIILQLSLSLCLSSVFQYTFCFPHTFVYLLEYWIFFYFRW